MFKGIYSEDMLLLYWGNYYEIDNQLSLCLTKLIQKEILFMQYEFILFKFAFYLLLYFITL